MTRSVTCWLLLAGLAAGLALADSASNTNRPAATGYIEKFEVPERDEDGNLRWKFMGDRAQIRDDGQLKVSNMRAEFYSSNTVAMVFTTPTCTLDQIRRKATTDAPVRIEAQNIIVTGDGADWTGADNLFVVRSNVHVVVTSKAAAAAPEPEPAKELVPDEITK